jgi:hypothetical protein
LNVVRGSTTGYSKGLVRRSGGGGCCRTSSSSTASPRIVISRRVWESHKKTIPPTPKPPKAKNPLDDKPWPRSVQITAYVAAAAFIPYTTIWLMVSVEPLRDFFKDYIPLDRFRNHFGEVEWGAQSYVDDVDRQRQKIPLDAGYSQFPGEWKYEIRTQQDEIEGLDKQEIPTKMYLILNSTSEQEQPIKYLPGSARANADTLWELIAGAATKEQKAPEGPIVAVDFPDDIGKRNDEDEPKKMLSDVKDAYAVSDSMPGQDVASSLLQKTFTYSTWFYQPTGTEGEAGGQTKRLSQQEVEISRLEFTVDRLEKDLKDPTCTRDMDDMTNELRQSKRELSRLKWKRRFGI